MAIKFCDYSDVRPSTFYQACVFTLEFDEMCRRVNMKPTRRFRKSGDLFYRAIGASIDDRRFAVLYGQKDFPQSIQLELELIHGTYWFENDLEKILDALGIDKNDCAISKTFKWKRHREHAAI
jgi:hypothetical protein